MTFRTRSCDIVRNARPGREGPPGRLVARLAPSTPGWTGLPGSLLLVSLLPVSLLLAPGPAHAQQHAVDDAASSLCGTSLPSATCTTTSWSRAGSGWRSGLPSDPTPLFSSPVRFRAGEASWRPPPSGAPVAAVITLRVAARLAAPGR
jgi:hypothetical protein